MRPLRIAVWYNLPSGGARRALYDQVRGLVARGHHVESWHPPRASTSGFADLGEIVSGHEVPMAEELPHGGSYLVRNRNYFAREPRRIVDSMEHARACAAEIARDDFDLLFAHNDAAFGAPFIGRAGLDLPKVLFLHEPYRHFYEASPRLPWLARPDIPRGERLHKRLQALYREAHDHRMLRVRAREEGDNARAFDRVLTNSYYSRESILKAYGYEGTDVRVAYLGVDFDLFCDQERVRERFVVSVGSVSKAKNVDLPLRALATLAPERRPALVWIGNFVEEPYRTEMLHLAESLGVELRIRLMVPDEELLDVLNRASAMVYVPHLEPFGYAPLEANACGLAVAGIAEGGLRETIVDGVNGRLADPEPGSLGRAIAAVMDDPDLRRSAVRHVRERWGLDRSVEGLEKQFYEVVASRTTSS